MPPVATKLPGGYGTPTLLDSTKASPMLGAFTLSAAGITTKFNVCEVAVAPVASAACMAKLKQPGVTGVPTRETFAVLLSGERLIPAGSAPD